MASIEIEEKLKWYVGILKRKYKKNNLPATAIGAEYLKGERNKKTDRSGPPPDINSFAPLLKIKLDNLGGVGTKLNNNTLGCCCEVRAANKILGKFQKIPPELLVFTPAVRPRTGQVIKRCPNCIEVFGNE
ncbi:MAG: hypothetical protein PHC51_02445 [bacterium]|nr:hypothetical protein [bacterium]MDD2941804.1 hypothetical protein [bacterium]